MYLQCSHGFLGQYFSGWCFTHQYKYSVQFRIYATSILSQNTNQQNTENKVPDIRYGEFSTTAKTKIPITKSTGILILVHRGVTEQTSDGAVYIITAGGARNMAALNPSGNFKVENGDGYAYVTSSETYWAYVYVTR